MTRNQCISELDLWIEELSNIQKDLESPEKDKATLSTLINMVSALAQVTADLNNSFRN